MAGAIVSSAMTRPALPRLPRSTSKALQAARNRAAAILSTCKLCADITDEALNNEVGIATPDREARKRGPAPSNEGWRQAVREARSLAGEAGKSAESQRGDQDAGRAGNRCRVLDQLSDWLFEVVDTKAQLACIAIGAALLGTLGAPAFAETQGCKEPTTGAKDAPVFSPPLANVMTGSGRLQFY